MFLSKLFPLAAAICGFMTTAIAYEAQTPLANTARELVPGNNGNTTYCTIPSSEQLFKIDFFEVAAVPIPLDKMFFTYLRGEMDESVTGLDEATIRFTVCLVDDDERCEPGTFTTPLETFGQDQLAHVTIRYTNGTFGTPGIEFGRTLRPGWNEILTDYWFPGIFVSKGMHKFTVEAFVPGKSAGDGEERYLFAFECSQWLDGKAPRRGSIAPHQVYSDE